MKGQIKKTISILLLACFLVSLTAAAVSAGSNNGCQAKSDNALKNDKGCGLEVVSVTTEINTPTYKVVDDGKSYIKQYAIILP